MLKTDSKNSYQQRPLAARHPQTSWQHPSVRLLLRLVAVGSPPPKIGLLQASGPDTITLNIDLSD